MIHDLSFHAEKSRKRRPILKVGEHGRYSYDVMGTDTDHKDQIHMHALISMLQEAASLNGADIGFGAEVMDQHNVCWLLLRMSVQMSRRPAWQERINIETWSCGYDKLFFPREYIMCDDDGEQIGTASTLWIVADKSTHRPVRPMDFYNMLSWTKEKYDLRNIMTELPPKICPMMDVSYMDLHQNDADTICKYADYSEIDRNLHVNNTRYIAWCLDAVHFQSLDQGNVLGIDINFLSEIHFAEKVVLFRSCDRDNCQIHVDGYVPSRKKVAFSAILHLREDE